MDEEASTSLVTRRTPWPAGLRSIEEQRKEEEEREQETRRQLQEQERRPVLTQFLGTCPCLVEYKPAG